MTARTLLAAALLAALCVPGLAQPPSGKLPPAQPPLPIPVKPAVPSPPGPKEQTLDQMLDALEHLRAEKAALEKREQELVAAIRLRLDKQAERVNRLGVSGPPAPPPAVLDSVLPGVPLPTGATKVESLPPAPK